MLWCNLASCQVFDNLSILSFYEFDCKSYGYYGELVPARITYGGDTILVVAESCQLLEANCRPNNNHDQLLQNLLFGKKVTLVNKQSYDELKEKSVILSEEYYQLLNMDISYIVEKLCPDGSCQSDSLGITYGEVVFLFFIKDYPIYRRENYICVGDDAIRELSESYHKIDIKNWKADSLGTDQYRINISDVLDTKSKKIARQLRWNGMNKLLGNPTKVIGKKHYWVLYANLSKDKNRKDVYFVVEKGFFGWIKKTHVEYFDYPL